MAAQIPVVGGSISYKPVSYTYGSSNQAINGGYSFDLPLATVASFTNAALTFSQQNTSAAQGFLGGVINQQQGAVTKVNDQSFAFQDKSLVALQDMYTQRLGLQKYAIKKRYGIGAALNPLANCFITTAITKTTGEPDNGPTLQYLRKFRDDVLLETEEGFALVENYYNIAPTIVEAIDAQVTSASIYHYLKCNFLDLIVQLISTGDYAGATATYGAMVEKAHELAGSPELPEVAEKTTTDFKPVFHPLGD